MDAFFQKSWVILLKQKPDVEAKLKEWMAVVETESGEKMGKFKSNNRA